ncbi:hypothetical protein PtA15_17A77 [Puccinia triticina]|uniref:Uncharacterized protein n=1 Tax=Puccinia triticina TaxID=208348 RepID=A0ABY7D5E4_9BASI|nr:uncharacterized protein PtA15_17A77 [Puccinia triticina]WAQ92596.1 hypothetical protein PtA15_17A77 [Puccinia triticina]
MDLGGEETQAVGGPTGEKPNPTQSQGTMAGHTGRQEMETLPGISSKKTTAPAPKKAKKATVAQTARRIATRSTLRVPTSETADVSGTSRRRPKQREVEEQVQGERMPE